MPDMDAVVDVSNVCWASDIEPWSSLPQLARLRSLTDAWRGLYGAKTRMELVVDQSLRYKIPAGDRGEFDRMCRTGELVKVPYADPVVLSMAGERGLKVISRDKFIDMRRRYAWIEGAVERFYDWRGKSGGLSFVPSGIVPVSGQVVSRAEEDKELTRDGLRDRKDVLGFAWKCVSRCAVSQLWPDRILLWPAVERGTGTPLCPDRNCRRPLVKAGPRKPSRQIVIARRDDGTEILRFPLEAGDCAEVGRGALTHGINLDGLGDHHREAVAAVSRHHLLLALDERLALSARDVGSSHGTELRRWGGQALGEPRRLAAGEEVRLNRPDQLVLAGAVVVRMSGRRYSPDVVYPDCGDGGGASTAFAEPNR
ncbi:FHA domain-containing protein [Streptomyces sp. ISL-10]|uniref:FHA domain-containing protein n=1 Tax=Streptomyces sp. ISL-10 TaxID=2819172 RepID=UPI001BE72801|nr:FHA domain-containing protein [Streptomyces sp. ISL-10]MBT2366376.1 FHA domain-containing protein [Streptomyces sp. ISL-10]